MAFGFGFNKQKTLSVAEKFVQQGKLQNAINEYEKILKADPKDLTVMNTVGDLYSRLGQIDNAIQCFKNVGDAYAGQGFTVKAIAMYKKLTKLKTSPEGVLRLAELYTQQGLFNDARAQYLQVADEFLRAGALDQAVRIFQKTLEMDPENVAMRMRLAEVYMRLGKKNEAWEIFSTAAESLRARGALGAASEIVERMLTLDPKNSSALLLRGRLAYDSGNLTEAIRDLEKVADLDNHTEGLHTLFQAYLKTGRIPDAGTLAAKLASVHSDLSAVFGYAQALLDADRFEDGLQIYQDYSDRLLASDSAKVLESLHSIIGHVRENSTALETLLALLQKAGEQTHITELYELLAHAYVQSGELEKARDYYLRLTQLEPQNQLHAHNYQQVITRLGKTPPGGGLITAEEGVGLAEELEATAPFLEQRHPHDVALTVRAALTDAELFVSYNMPSKALDPLLAALPRAPKDARLNQRLAALHTRLSQFAEAAASCRVLEDVYGEAGYPEEATRYGELAKRYEDRAAHVEAPPPPQEIKIEMPIVPSAAFSQEAAPAQLTEAISETPAAVDSAAGSAEAPVAPPASTPTPPRRSGLFWHAPVAASLKASAPAPEEVTPEPAAAAEIDLSEEWEGATADASGTAATAPAGIESKAKPKGAAAADSETIAETASEVRFYLRHSMLEQAHSALTKLRQMGAGPAILSALRNELEAAERQAAQGTGSEAVAEEIEVVADESSSESEAVSAAFPGLAGARSASPAAVPEFGVPPQPVQHADAASESLGAGILGEFVADLETSLGDSFLDPAAGPASPKTAPPSVALPRPVIGTSGAAAAAAPARQPAPKSAAQGAAAAPAPASPLESPGVDLADMFTELKHELNEDAATATGEDPETHYNLGVAFREMGLLDEAISELQKVCQAIEHGHPFAHTIQAYTWLAQCFLDKGIPEAAIRWYERALHLPNLDGDTSMALHYELGSSYEAAQNKNAALNHFMEVYGSNIDYRDVAERIRTLRS